MLNTGFNKFFKLLISATSQESSKRFAVVTLILAFLGLNIVLTILMILLFVKALNVPENTVTQFFDLFKLVVQNDFYIICFGIGATAVVSGAMKVGDVMMEKMKAKIIAAQTGTPQTEVNVENVENVDGRTQ